jgi:recombination protein RecT
MNNSLQPKSGKMKFSVMLQTDGIKNLINNTLGDPKRATNFVANISSAVAVNPTLQECEAFTILNAALLGESLNLSPSPQLGHYYLVPFNDKDRGKIASFQLGYKGYIQLAMRSGQYKKLNVLAIKEGELVKFNPLDEEIEVNLIEDDEIRESKPTIGYYAMFEYLNGFRKCMYWSVKKMKAHAMKYSQGYRSDVTNGKAWTFWSKDFDGMAYKTMLRQLISKWGIMSVELQKAFENDMAAIKEGGKVEYVDNVDDAVPPVVIPPESTPIPTPEPKKPQVIKDGQQSLEIDDDGVIKNKEFKGEF